MVIKTVKDPKALNDFEITTVNEGRKTYILKYPNNEMVNALFFFSTVNHGAKEPAIPRMLRLSREFLDLAERHPSPLKRLQCNVVPGECIPGIVSGL